MEVVYAGGCMDVYPDVVASVRMLILMWLLQQQREEKKFMLKKGPCTLFKFVSLAGIKYKHIIIKRKIKSLRDLVPKKDKF